MNTAPVHKAGRVGSFVNANAWLVATAEFVSWCSLSYQKIQQNSLKQQNVSSHRSGDQKSRLVVPAGWHHLDVVVGAC